MELDAVACRNLASSHSFILGIRLLTYRDVASVMLLLKFGILYLCCASRLSYLFCISHGKRKRSPVTGLELPRGFQEVKVPRFHDNGTGMW